MKDFHISSPFGIGDIGTVAATFLEHMSLKNLHINFNTMFAAGKDSCFDAMELRLEPSLAAMERFSAKTVIDNAATKFSTKLQ